MVNVGPFQQTDYFILFYIWVEPGRTGTVQSGEEKAQKDMINVWQIPEGEVRRQIQTLLCSSQWQEKKQLSQTKIQEILFKPKKTLFYVEDDQTWEQAVKYPSL